MKFKFNKSEDNKQVGFKLTIGRVDWACLFAVMGTIQIMYNVIKGQDIYWGSIAIVVLSVIYILLEPNTKKETKKGEEEK
jgi:hypothetical protein